MTTNYKTTWRDYLDLCKLRVVLLMLITAYVGMALASPGLVPWSILIFGLLGIGLLASAAAAINHLVDRHVDAIMGRTLHRPIPTGRVTMRNAILFAVIIGCLGFIILVIFVNWLTAILTALTLVGYAVIYTMFLKRSTPQNIVIGGFAGAMPPLLGWTAVSGHFAPQAWLLVMIIFIWTPPHFWALAIFRHEEYAKIDLPMLTKTHGLRYTRNCVFIYTLVLSLVTLMPYYIDMSGLIYLIGTIILNVIFIIYASFVCFSENVRWGMKTFRYSIIYLLLLFVLMLVDHYLPFGG